MTVGAVPKRRLAGWAVVVLSSLIGLAVLLSPANAATGAPKTEVKTVPAELVFERKNEPGDAGHCAAIVFVKWADVPYTLSATAFYTYTLNSKTEERSLTGVPPFDDYYKFVADFTVPFGSHWLAAPPSWSDGPVANDCSKAQGVQQERYFQPARVELTVEVQEPVDKTDPKACADAQKNLKARNKAVSRLLGKLKNAEGKKAKARIRGKLAKAKSKRAKAVQKVATDC